MTVPPVTLVSKLGRQSWAAIAQVGLRATVALGGELLVIATLLPLLQRFWPSASIVEHFAIQIVIAAIATGILAFVLRRWRWLSVVTVVALIQLWTIHPYWPRSISGLLAAQADTATAGANEMKMISLNVHFSGDSYEAVRQYLSHSNADVIGLIEVSPRWKVELANLSALYPHSISCIDTDAECEEILLSKYPFQRRSAGHINGAMPILVWGEIRAPSGQPIILALSHVAWPFKKLRATAERPIPSLPAGLPRLAQAEQTVNLAAGLNDLGSDVVLLGDFNAAPWSGIQRYLRQQTGLDNRDFLAPSWPAWGPAFIRLPIDHVMTRGRAHLMAFQPGPNVGSDHRPVEAIIAFGPP